MRGAPEIKRPRIDSDHGMCRTLVAGGIEWYNTAINLGLLVATSMIVSSLILSDRATPSMQPHMVAGKPKHRYDRS